MTSIQKKRLARFINFLRKVPRSNFNMEHWIVADGETSQEVICDLKQHKCGTAGCAVGWMPVFNPKVFKYDMFWNAIVLNENNLILNVDAAIEYFGIKAEVARQIFYYMDEYGEYGYPANHFDTWTDTMVVATEKITPKMVASRLAKYLKRVKAGIED